MKAIRIVVTWGRERLASKVVVDLTQRVQVQSSLSGSDFFQLLHTEFEQRELAKRDSQLLNRGWQGSGHQYRDRGLPEKFRSQLLRPANFGVWHQWMAPKSVSSY